MPRPRDPNRDRAFELYRKSGGSLDLVEIASQLKLPGQSGDGNQKITGKTD